MKRITILLLIIIILTGCSKKNALEDYKKALLETEKIEKGTISIDVNMDIEFNIEGLLKTEKRTLSYFENIKYSMEQQFDLSNKKDVKVIAYNYYNIGGVGIDSTFYLKDKVAYLEVPIVGKYIKMDNLIQEDETSINQNNDMFNLVDKWSSLLENDNVILKGREYILTNEGQIKTTLYRINITTEQAKKLSNSAINMLKGTVIDRILENQQNININKEQAIEDLERILNKTDLDRFEGKAYIDSKGRIIKQEFNIGVNIVNASKKEPNKINLVIKIENSKFGKTQELDFPVISEEDIIEIDSNTKLNEILPNRIF